MDVIITSMTLITKSLGGYETPFPITKFATDNETS